jgi:hypothetical protein
MRTLRAAGQPPPGKEPDGWRTMRSQCSVLASEIEAEDSTLRGNPPGPQEGNTPEEVMEAGEAVEATRAVEASSVAEGAGMLHAINVM